MAPPPECSAGSIQEPALAVAVQLSSVSRCRPVMKAKCLEHEGIRFTQSSMCRLSSWHSAACNHGKSATELTLCFAMI